MKKGFKIKALLLLLVVALTSGCVKVEQGFKISNSDVEFNYVMGMQKAYYSMMTGEGDPFKEYNEEYKNKGFTVEEYDDGSYKGIKVVKKLGSLAERSTEKEVGTIELTEETITKLEEMELFQKTGSGFFKTTYKASFKTNAMEDVNKMANESSMEDDDDEIVLDDDTTTEGAENEITPDEAEEPVITTGVEAEVVEADDEITTTGSDSLDDLSNQLSESMVVNFVVELPSAPGKNNATKVDGKTLTWDLKTLKDGTISYTVTY